MKALIFLLVVANLLFYAFSQGYFGHADNPDAGRVEQQVKPDSIRIVARGEPAAGAAKESETAASVPAAPAGEAVPTPEIAPKPEAKNDAKPETKEVPPKEVKEGKEEAAASLCLAWEHLSVAEADRLTAVFGERFAKLKLSRKAVDAEVSGWWVYIPPLAGKSEADKKASELRNLGVTDYFTVQDGPNRFAISLGVFSSEKGAQERLAELKGKGVRSAKLTPRPGKDGSITLEARGSAVRQTVVTAASGALPKATAADCQ
ncbi:SPOR domain-containing protein [Azonexus sp. IMCC34839]|uniref:SPOR domain-containing protein n=1 Tax=Azonexus sp. IMCC34839 TaxID=3133695 RepID=UPI0039994AC5